LLVVVVVVGVLAPCVCVVFFGSKFSRKNVSVFRKVQGNFIENQFSETSFELQIS